MTSLWTGAAWALQGVDPAQVNTNTLISLGTVLVLIGAAWRLSSVLTQINEQQRQTNKSLEELKELPNRMTRVEGRVRDVRAHLEGLEEDVSILWTTQRGEPLDNIRRKTRRKWSEDEEREE